MRPGLEGTGPAIDLGMAMGALNTGAASWMWDWEDAGGDYKDQLYQAWENLRDLLAHNGSASRSCIRRRSRAGSRASTRSICRPKSGRRSSTACRDCTCRTGRSRSTAEQVPAIIPALVMHAVNNYDTQKQNGSGVYYYVPKIETWQEARLVSQPAEESRRGARPAARHAEDQDAERARRIRPAAGSDHVGAAREPHRAERRAMGLSEQPRGDVPPRSGDGDSRSRTP